MITEIEEKTRGGEGQDIASKVQQTASEWQQTVQEWQQRATDNAKRAWDSTDSYVRRNPWPILGAAALVGLALGILLRRNRD